MDHIIHPFKSSPKPVLIPHIANEIPHDGFMFPQLILHQKLLELVPGINDDLLGVVMRQHIFGKTLSKRACPTGYQDRFII